MTNQQIIPADYGRTVTGKLPPGSRLPIERLSKEAKAIFAKWEAYKAALGRKPSAFHVTKQQAATLNKSLRRIDDKMRCTDFTFDGLKIKVTE